MIWNILVSSIMPPIHPPSCLPTLLLPEKHIPVKPRIGQGQLLQTMGGCVSVVWLGGIMPPNMLISVFRGQNGICQSYSGSVVSIVSSKQQVFYTNDSIFLDSGQSGVGCQNHFPLEGQEGIGRESNILLQDSMEICQCNVTHSDQPILSAEWGNPERNAEEWV